MFNRASFIYLSPQKEFEATKVVIRIRKSKDDRQYNGQMKMDKRTNNDLQNIIQKTTDRATKTLLKTWSELRCSGREGVPAPHVTSVTLRKGEDPYYKH